MPFTFLAHQAPVAPLKLLWPRRVAGAALMIGSMAPDFEYFVRGQIYASFSHEPAGLVLFCLPLTLGILWLWRHTLAVPLAAHVPKALGLEPADLRLVAAPRPGYAGHAVIGALCGAASHLLLDACTHHDGAAVLRFAPLRAVINLGGTRLPVYRALQTYGSLAAAAFVLLILVIVARRRLMPRLADVAGVVPPPLPRATAVSTRALWGTTALVLVVGLAWAALRLTHGDVLWQGPYGALRASPPGRSFVKEALGVLFCHGVTFGFVGACLGGALAQRRMDAPSAITS